MTTKIDSFRGDFAFLSNFYPSSMWYDGRRYKTLEAAYQAQKTLDPVARETIAQAKSPLLAKKLGYAVKLRGGWDSMRVNVMGELVREKFLQNPLLREMLLVTEEVDLEEGNDWCDNYFGVCRCPKCPGSGENWLGRILMVVRAEARAEGANDDALVVPSTHEP